MAEVKIPIIRCTERIYDIPYIGKIVRIKSKQTVNSDDQIDELIKEEQEILNFINKYEILEIISDVSQADLPKTSLSLEHILPKQEIEVPLPKEEEVIAYITSKDLFEHNTIELQEKFLGMRLPVRENPTLYGKFDNILRTARKHIADKHNGKWDNRKTVSFGKRTHVTVYTFIKNPVIESNQLSPSTENHIVETHQIEQEGITALFA